MNWIDSHCHLKSFYEKGELVNVLSNAEDVGLKKFINVGTSPTDWSIYRNLAELYNNMFYYTAGIHPLYVDQDWSASLDMLKSFWSLSKKPCALGEVGLDYFRLPKDAESAIKIIQLQKECLVNQLELAKELKCNVVIHSRNSFADCFSIIEEIGLDWKKVVFHCYSEGLEQLKKLKGRGAKASFTAMSFYEPRNNIRSALKWYGLDELMIETDSPYLPLKRGDRNANEPSSIPAIGKLVSELLEQPLDLVAKKTYSNTVEFFNLN
tara:strand:- start:2119 stop:2916 length:798 start_codon:yes stop_codon:yes gene_type:complete